MLRNTQASTHHVGTASTNVGGQTAIQVPTTPPDELPSDHSSKVGLHQDHGCWNQTSSLGSPILLALFFLNSELRCNNSGLATVKQVQSGKDRACRCNRFRQGLIALTSWAWTERPGEDLRSEGTHGSVPMLDLSVALNRGTRWVRATAVSQPSWNCWQARDDSLEKVFLHLHLPVHLLTGSYVVTKEEMDRDANPSTFTHMSLVFKMDGHEV